jgi:hypothetical protein
MRVPIALLQVAVEGSCVEVARLMQTHQSRYDHLSSADTCHSSYNERRYVMAEGMLYLAFLSLVEVNGFISTD